MCRYLTNDGLCACGSARPFPRCPFDSRYDYQYCDIYLDTLREIFSLSSRFYFDEEMREVVELPF